ncbi:MAG: fatty acid desaturase [Myxococcales bacterium]|nr:fatty acid desaturase [Myxococcales bacterium]
MSPRGAALLRRLAAYRPDTGRALRQLGFTLSVFTALWLAMLAALQVSFLLTLLLAIPAGVFLLRLFIIQHDCGHGSFTPSKRLNQVIGRALGVLTFTPYDYWKQTHAIHHATSGNLDRRGYGDITTLTVAEYEALSPRARFGYRFYRHPLTLLVVGPAYQFLVKHRLPLDAPKHWRDAWKSVWMTNLALAGLFALAALTIGIGDYLMVQIPLTLTASAMGIFLFYVQHQYEHAYWEHDKTWDFTSAGLEGSSFLDLPRPLHWLTGNISYHHIHHLASRVPNYELPRAFDEIDELREVPHLTLGDAFRSLRLRLWDEDRRVMITFGELAARPAASAPTPAPVPPPPATSLLDEAA